MKALTRLILPVAAAFCTVQARATLLTFEAIHFSGAIHQSYGDAADIDVSYFVRTGFGHSAVDNSNILYYASGYGDLVSVAWGGTGSGDSNKVGHISLAAAAGYEVTLHSFDLAGWQGDRPGRSVRIYDGSYSSLVSYGPMTIDGSNGPLPDDGHTSFNPEITGTILNLQWDFPWAVAIDNVNFTVSPLPMPVPEGGSVATFGAVMLAAWATVRRGLAITG